jgi:cytochrome c oxidase subunit 2
MRVVVTALFAVALASCAGSPTPTQQLASEGERLYRSEGCASCHSIDGEAMTGPTWKGLYGNRVQLDDGTAVTADEHYLRESMIEPDAKTAKGFGRGVMASVVKTGSLHDRDIDALVAYIKTLK